MEKHCLDEFRKKQKTLPKWNLQEGLQNRSDIKEEFENI